MASHENKKMIFNNKVLVIKEGQLVTGRKALAEQTGLAQSTCEDILNFLENEGQIQQQKNNKFRLITIINWKTYQEKRQPAGQPAGQPADTINNNNKENNTLATAVAEEWDSKKYLEKLVNDKQKHIQIIGLYFSYTGKSFPTRKAAEAELRRWMKDARILADYPDTQIAAAQAYVEKNFPEMWNLGTILKNISKF